MPRQYIQTKSVTDFEHVIGYTFKKQDLLRQALTHASAVAENHPTAFSRDLTSLAFVGDAALKYSVARYLFLNGLDSVTRSSAELHEGAQRVISNNVLAEIGREKLHLEEYLVRGNTHRIVNMNIYADCMEAILGAIALDCGTDQQEVIFRVVEKMCSDRVEPLLMQTQGMRLASATNNGIIDWPKSELQSAIHNRRTASPRHGRSCCQTLGRFFLWIFAIYGLIGFCFIVINEFESISSKFKKERRWYEL
ncbi:unnamed protein product [Adineta steineri]|uniref:RNase III domain-containing protein n=1 Tax=Adineta steineri TaxID=433720 RepID=A0A814JTK6_9BILA|nr:unnamed protein product [Adineta steineri]